MKQKLQLPFNWETNKTKRVDQINRQTQMFVVIVLFLKEIIRLFIKLAD